MVKFYEKLNVRFQSTRSLLCIGLDPYSRYNLKKNYPKSKQPYFDFCKDIIDATAEFACAFKFQFAFFGSQGVEEDLEHAINYVQSKYSEIPIILDSKRGDIGSTATEYAKEAFIRYGADALTINPYLGGDSIQVFTDYSDHGVIILCRTSNPGSAQIQELRCGDRMLFEHVAYLAANQWNENGNIALVMGATHPKALSRVRKIVGDMLFLVPGIGAQGGNLRAALEHGLTEQGNGLIVNVSRDIVEAGMKENQEFDLQAVHDAAQHYFDRMQMTTSNLI
ncbi:MAG: orotidine-5'-phosphate decarboxylase [Gammaproteobacteria bacterium]|nr:orotidine-5'-phosphate decarboxylase [Gammaproteobacteria bacterium]MCY4217750.1 orotidine-5'-phosphate decarboxylase [Gammaproteobacteria bacterium]MCY4275998.1 orotidine-5'-phosphate decarboxylase [Gammaproteobacteria bacterium]